jgi:hypothetical protein
VGCCAEENGSEGEIIKGNPEEPVLSPILNSQIPNNYSFSNE